MTWDTLTMSKLFDKIARALCALLCLCMLACLFTGCSDGDEENTEDTAESTTESKALDTLILADDGSTDYCIYYAASLATGGSGAAMLVNTMAKQIKSMTGADMEVSADNRYSETLADKPAILIGDTKFAESAEAAKKLTKVNDYYLGIIGNKLVIYSGSAESCMTAIQYFMNNIIAVQKQQGRTLTFSKSDEYKFTETYGIDSVKILGTELSEYSLVVAKNANVNESYFANTLRYWLMQEYGVLLDMNYDTSNAGEHEIIIGSTSRSAAAELNANEYSIRTSGGNLLLCANGYAAYDELYVYITKTLIPTGKSASYTISETSMTVDATESYEKRMNVSLSYTGDIRAMYYNVYGWTGYNYDLRVQMQIELFKTYAPDIIGLQEFTPNARASKLYNGLRSLGYNEVDVDTSGQYNYTPLFYNEAKLKVVENGCGWLLYDGLNDSNSKSVTWAVFEVKATGERFIAMSTHFYYTSDSDGAAARESEARQLISLIEQIRTNADYASLPLIVGGDLNCRLASNPLKVLSDGGLSNTWEVAVDKNDIDGKHSHYEYDSTYGIYKNVGKPTDNFSDSIDHSYVSDGVTVNSFRTLYNEYVMVASDHSPELIDISF